MKGIKTMKGFSLIELMIVVAIMGIIAAIAIPAYQNQILSSRRADSMSELLQMHMQQEGYRLENISYATTAQLDVPTSDFFTYTVADVSATTFTLKATAKSSQTGDTSCKILTLDQSMNKTPAICW